MEQWQRGPAEHNLGPGQRPSIRTLRRSIAKSRVRPPNILGTQVQILHPQTREKEKKCPGYRPYASGQDYAHTLPTPSASTRALSGTPHTASSPPFDSASRSPGPHSSTDRQTSMLMPILLRKPLTNFNNAFDGREKNVPVGICRVNATAARAMGHWNESEGTR
jgi:hypothetical protein